MPETKYQNGIADHAIGFGEYLHKHYEAKVEVSMWKVPGANEWHNTRAAYSNYLKHIEYAAKNFDRSPIKSDFS